jgi:hypothetical protein
MSAVDIGAFGGYALGLYKVTVRLAGGSDTAYVIACDAEDAVKQVRKATEDLNVLYLESLERLAGTFYVSEEAEAVFRSPSRK